MVDIAWVKQCYSVFLILCTSIYHAQSDVPRPRGVSIAKASLYSPTKDFTCFDGSVTVPFSYVNDDYCDCFDGSDEPGTSACLNAIFHCTNAGHRSQNIPSSRINDGVCDCCDGTDEYASPDTCTNTCEALGREARAEAERMVELFKAGSVVRQELIAQGNYKRSEMAEQLTQLQKDKVEAEALKAEKEVYKKELESKEDAALKVYREAEEQDRQLKLDHDKETQIKEASDYFSKYDSNNDDILNKDEARAVTVFDKNKDGQVDDEEIQFFFGEKDNLDTDTFVQSTWPMLKSVIVGEQGFFSLPEDNEHETDAEDTTSDQDTEYNGHDDNSDLDSPHDDGEEPETEHQESSMAYDEETQKLINEASEARRQVVEAERTIREIESNIRNIQQKLEKDYGPQQEFATLDETCLDYDDKEYTYTLCFFQKVVQKSKNGGAQVGLGNWGEWDGPENNKYSVMKYTNGVACWNGPNRMTTVNINCGLETKLLSVTEPFRCEYKIEISTPAACDEANVPQLHSHDEL